jgi:hypothetical protein
MSQPLFSVSDPAELLALWRLVAEAKFQPDPDDADLWGSPHVNAVSQRISDALLGSYELKGDAEAIARHHRWASSLETNVVLPVVRVRLKADATTEWWSKYSFAQKLAYVEECIAPFKPGSSFLEGLVREAEA